MVRKITFAGKKLRLRKDECVDLGGKPCNWTGEEEKNYKTHNLKFSHLQFLVRR